MRFLGGVAGAVWLFLILVWVHGLVYTLVGRLIVGLDNLIVDRFQNDLYVDVSRHSQPPRPHSVSAIEILEEVQTELQARRSITFLQNMAKSSQRKMEVSICEFALDDFYCT